MLSHHTKDKGDLGILKAQVDLYLNPVECGSNATLRVEVPRNGQRRHVRFAADHRRVP